jgi:hypothetical protein
VIQRAVTQAGRAAGLTKRVGCHTFRHSFATHLSVVPLPEGTDVSTMEAVRKSMKLLAPVNFVFPLLGHALGTLTGAFVAAKLAASHHMKIALGIGLIFLIGGIAMVLNCGGPVWFIATDLLLAYIPMALLGGFLAGRKRTQTTAQLKL